jgi:hypothetical protein
MADVLTNCQCGPQPKETEPVIILLNGSFGIGKTTVAALLRSAIEGSAICDPERIGIFLWRLPRWVPLTDRDTDDFQDMKAWRQWTVRGIRSIRLLHHTVIVPMAFSNLDYLSEIRSGLERFDRDIRQFCLVAPLDVIQERLIGRGADPATPGGKWAFRRAAECCTAHTDAAFGDPVPAAHRSPAEIAADIVARLGSRALA